MSEREPRTAAPDRMSILLIGIVTHLWKHPRHVKGCEVCQCIKTGVWP